MSWDIYGNTLASGHCEVHPQVDQSWPCYLCHEETAYEAERRDCEERMYQKWMLEQQALDSQNLPVVD